MSSSTPHSRLLPTDGWTASGGWRRTAPAWHANARRVGRLPSWAAHSRGGSAPMSWGRFDTRTIVLIPIAIAINIVLGQTVSAVLKVPIYLDSLGTILVAVLAGPIPVLVTGLLANLIWTYVLPPPFHSDFAAPFAIVAAWIGFFAGLVAQWGFFRSRPNSDWGRVAITAVIVILVLGGIGYYGFLPFYTGGDFTFFGDTSGGSPIFVFICDAITLPLP